MMKQYVFEVSPKCTKISDFSHRVHDIYHFIQTDNDGLYEVREHHHLGKVTFTENHWKTLNPFMRMRIVVDMHKAFGDKDVKCRQLPSNYPRTVVYRPIDFMTV